MTQYENVLIVINNQHGTRYVNLKNKPRSICKVELQA